MLLSSLASAEISLSQPKGVYSVGDDLSFSLTVKSGESSEGFLKMSLICGDNSSDFYLAPFSINANEEKRIDSNITLSKSFLGDLQGTCKVFVKTPHEEATSQSFEITDRIELTITPNKLGFSSGESVALKGSALKPNAKPFSGFLEVTLEGTDVKVIKSISNKDFSVNFSLPESLRSGSYIVKSWVYEKDKNGEVTNQGTNELNISISKIPQKLEIMIDTQSVTPGNNVSFKVFMYDQADDEIAGDVSVLLRDPENEVGAQRLVKTNTFVSFPVDRNATPGYWKIEANYQKLSVKRLFYVENQELASFEIIGDLLYIRNIGNAPYRKAIQIAIGNDVEIKDLELEIGEVKKFRLVAPNGVYKVSVTDGKETITLDTVSLTGNVVGVVSEKSQNVFAKYPLVWIFIIIVFGMFILMIFERFSEKKFIAYNMNGKTPMEVKKQWTTEGMTFGNVRQAEHALALNGPKEEASLIAFKIKNMQDLGKDHLHQIEGLFNEVSDKKGVVYKTGDYLVIILTPSLTKSFKNNPEAVKLAKSIGDKFEEYNKKFAKKITYGIGVSKGNLIVEPHRELLKFASVGNSLNLAKKIADLSQGEVLLSKEANAQLDGSFKTEKTQKEGHEVYSLKQLSHRGDYDGFIQGFLHRNKQDS